MLRRGESSLSTRVRMCGWAGAGVPELSASARADAARACRHVCGVCMCVYVRVRRCAWVGGMGLGGLRRSGQERRWQVWRCSLRLEGCCTVVARSRGRVRVRGSLEVRASDRGSSLIVMCVPCGMAIGYIFWAYTEKTRPGHTPLSFVVFEFLYLQFSKFLEDFGRDTDCRHTSRYIYTYTGFYILERADT